MTTWRDLQELLGELTPEELAEVEALLDTGQLWEPLPGPQMTAYFSEADEIGYGGAAGGGKTDLAIGLSLNRHRKVIVYRSNGTEHLGMVDRLGELLTTRDGWSSKDGVWRIPPSMGLYCQQIEFGSLPNPRDEEKYRGRPHDLIVFDECTSIAEYKVRFLMAWCRTTDVGQRCQTLMTFNPPTSAEGRWVIDYFAPWLDHKHPNPAQPGELRWFASLGGKDVEVEGGKPFTHNGELITPKSRTFIPSRVTDNPHLVGTGYMAQLQALPEPLRSQMLYGDFRAGVEDDAFQVIPTSWVEAAMARWSRPLRLPPMDSMGVDVARGGRDNTAIARRHGWWFDEPVVAPGSSTPTGSSVAGLVIAHRRDRAPVHLDVIGVGASPYDFLKEAQVQIEGVNVSETARGTDKSGRLTFANRRAELYWRFRELLDPESNMGVCLPPNRQLLVELTAPRWELRGTKVYVESRDDIIARIGRSPDLASAYILAAIETPKECDWLHGDNTPYDPYARIP